MIRAGVTADGTGVQLVLICTECDEIIAEHYVDDDPTNGPTLAELASDALDHDRAAHQ